MNKETKATFEGLIALVKENPRLAKYTPQIEAKWVQNMVCETKILGQFGSADHVLINDEPQLMGGTDKGPGPALLVLAGLAGCTTASFVLLGTLMGTPIDSVELSLTADLDLRGFLGLEEGVPVGFTDIRYEAQIQSSASEKKVRELAVTVERRCPAYDTLRRLKEIKGKVLLNGKDLC